jgi:hypothetical protein
VYIGYLYRPFLTAWRLVRSSYLSWHIVYVANLFALDMICMRTANLCVAVMQGSVLAMLLNDFQRSSLGIYWTECAYTSSVCFGQVRALRHGRWRSLRCGEKARYRLRAPAHQHTPKPAPRPRNTATPPDSRLRARLLTTHFDPVRLARTALSTLEKS